MRWWPLALALVMGCTRREANPVAERPAPVAASAIAPASASASVGAAAPAPSASEAAVSDAGADEARSDGVPGCRFERLAEWTLGRVTWLGGCRGGFAHGNGVMLREVEDIEPERFYGRVENGHATLGVLSDGGGYKAGAWSHGAVSKPPDDGLAARNVVIEAFEAAGKAASAVSDSFAKKSDAASSRFYATEARRLRNQMD